MANRDVVVQVIAELNAKGVSMSGSCGAFRITNEVAKRLGFYLLRKNAGNRAVPQADGSCLSGEQTTAPGYATDYVIDPTTFYGYDLLGDGGGANNPQFIGPETDPVMVARNRTYSHAAENWPPAPVVVVPLPAEPTEPTEPTEPVTEPPVAGIFDLLLEQLRAINAEVVALRAELADLRAKGAVAENRYLGKVTLTFPK
jgi:hypothetical protein